MIFILYNKKKSIYYLVSVLGLFFILGTSTVLADFTQSDDTTTATENVQNVDVEQYIGSDWSGLLTNIHMRIHVNSGNTSFVAITLNEYDSYSDFINGSTSNSESGGTSCSSLGSGNYDCSRASTYTMNSAKFYSITPFGSNLGFSADWEILGSAGDSFPDGAYYASSTPYTTGSIGDAYFSLIGTPTHDGDTSTHIVDFTPEDNATTSNPVTFSLHAYIAPEDVGGYYGIAITFHNIDQNVFLFNSFSPSDLIFLSKFQATSSGDYYYSTTTTIGAGNYRVNAKLTSTVVWGLFDNPFSGVNKNESHQFIVCDVGTTTPCAGTYIGGLSQNGFNEIQSILGNTSATTTAAAARTCSPISGEFDTIKCLSFLLIPGGDYLNNTIATLQAGVLNRAPWGYATRVYNIFAASSTSPLPIYTASVQVGPGDNMTPEVETITIDPGDMIAGAGALLDSIHDPIHGMSIKDVFEPLVKLTVALAVLLTIYADIMRSHNHTQIKESKNS